MTNAFLDLSSTPVRILDAYIALAKSGNRTPSYSEVAEVAKLTTAGVAKHIELLIERGYLTKREGKWRNIVLTKKAS